MASTSNPAAAAAATRTPPHIRPIRKSDEAIFRNLWDQYNEFYARAHKIPADVFPTTFARFLDDNVRMYAAVAVAVAPAAEGTTTTTTTTSADDEKDNGKVIGFVTWYPHPSTSSVRESVYLHDLFVDPATRNGGVGRALIEHVYAHARDVCAADRVYWHTQYFNHRAQLLYVKAADRTDFVMYNKTL